MVAKKMNMDMLTDLLMTRLFQLAAYVCDRFPFVAGKREVAVVEVKPEPHQPTIRFSKEDRMVEGELFQ